MRRPSGETASAVTAPSPAGIVAISSPPDESQIFIVPSHDPETIRRPSLENATAYTKVP